MSELVTVERVEDVAVVYLANSARHNVLTMEMAEQLALAIENNDAAAIVLLAEGEHFCLGGDVTAFAAAADPERFVGDLARAFHRVVIAMRSAGAPVVVGLRGWAAGAGMSLVLAGDVVVAGESAMMRPAYPGIGLTPDGGMSWTLPRTVGQRRALSILLGNQVLTAGQAHELGIIDDVVPDAVVDTQALAFAHRLTDGPTSALAGIKRLLLEGAYRTLGEQLEAEADSIGARAAMPEGREGVSAFMDRRKPDFRTARDLSSHDLLA
jgi:2-(1,2-epoxy-1,2-dihydrophenyl)acetyl-CoA isomerase